MDKWTQLERLCELLGHEWEIYWTGSCARICDICRRGEEMFSGGTQKYSTSLTKYERMKAEQAYEYSRRQ